MNRLLPLLILLTFSAQAQEPLHCGADEMRIATLQADPKIAQAVVQRDAELEAFTQKYALRQAQGTQRGGGSPYIIPVVFHVIHKYGNENISREQILDGLDVLNETFRKQIPDTADIHPDFKPIHADCEIEFKLATKDPEGNCHSGINRMASTLTNSGDHRVKELIHWDPTMYLNVYIVSNAAGLAGHAVWPADADTIPEWDGIVMSHNYVGRIGTSDQTRSVVFAHECGHYLNLHHIWGGNNVPEFYYLPVGQQANCNEDDLVQDTPNTIGWSSCNLNAASCGNVRDNVQNAMDYSYCNVMFTEGQKTRMHACLNSPIAARSNLWTPANLAATGVEPSAGLCAADFEVDNRLVCAEVENTVTFTAAAFHGDLDSLRWTFEGGTPATAVGTDPTITYTQGGNFDVSLKVYANGQMAEVVKENFISVTGSSASAFPFWDWFEGFDPIAEQGWIPVSLDADNEWTVTDQGFYSSNHSLMLDNWENDRLTVDELYSPPIDISNVSQMRLAFRYAFTSKNIPATNNSKLQLQVRKDCASNWATRLTLNGSSMQTAPPQTQPFQPQTGESWIQESISIPSTYYTEDFQFRFVFTSEGNNRLFIDDVNVDVAAGIANNTSYQDAVVLYPNPADDVLQVRHPFRTTENLQVTIMDARGRMIPNAAVAQTLSTEALQISVGTLPAGLYLMELATSEFTVTKRFIKL